MTFVFARSLWEEFLSVAFSFHTRSGQEIRRGKEAGWHLTKVMCLNHLATRTSQINIIMTKHSKIKIHLLCIFQSVLPNLFCFCLVFQPSHLLSHNQSSLLGVGYTMPAEEQLWRWKPRKKASNCRLFRLLFFIQARDILSHSEKKTRKNFSWKYLILFSFYFIL